MPEYLTPGVYVEEVSFRPSSIQAASTSVAGMIGPTRFGPVRGRPLLLTSYSDYVAAFGDAEDLTLGGTAGVNYTAYAARAFFDNGGRQLYLSRVVYDVLGEGGDQSKLAAAATLAITATSGATTTTLVTLGARFAGAAGNFRVVLTPRRSHRLLQTTVPKASDTVRLNLTNVRSADLLPAGGSIPATAFPLQKLLAVATHQTADASGTPPERYQFLPGQPVLYVDKDGKSSTVLGSAFATAIAAAVVSGAGGAMAVSLVAPNDIGSAPLYSVPVGPVMTQLLGLPAGAAASTLYGTFSAGSGGTMAFPKSLNPALAGDMSVPVAMLALGTRPGDGNAYHDNFDVGVFVGAEAVYSFANVSLEQDAANNLAVAMAQSPASGNAQNTQPIYASYTGSVAAPALWGALMAKFDKQALNPADASVAPSYVLTLAGGSDGAPPATADYAGQVDEVNGSFGLAALEAIDEVSIVLCPAAAADPSIHQAVTVEIQKHCNKMLYRVGIVDSEQGQAIADVQAFRALFSDTRLALYYPWVTAASLTPNATEVLLPPSGFIAGVYAGTDFSRGVHKAPANEVVLGALGLEVYINANQQAVLNPVGINCIRFFPDRGFRVWGDRTLADDPQWRYVNVRRYFLYLEHSISNSTNWVVFEPNGPALWNNVKATVSDFLYNEWANGHLLGVRPEQAYFVRCDLTTMTQNDLDNGRLVCLIGAAPLEPAEFVIFRIGQMTATA